MLLNIQSNPPVYSKIFILVFVRGELFILFCFGLVFVFFCVFFCYFTEKIYSFTARTHAFRTQTNRNLTSVSEVASLGKDGAPSGEVDSY